MSIIIAYGCEAENVRITELGSDEDRGRWANGVVEMRIGDDGADVPVTAYYEAGEWVISKEPGDYERPHAVVGEVVGTAGASQVHDIVLCAMVALADELETSEWWIAHDLEKPAAKLLPEIVYAD